MSSLLFNDETNDELPFEENFIEQAEYIGREKFLLLAADHPREASILKKLVGGGAKLLIGPRGCGKSTLMRKAYYGALDGGVSGVFPIYVNFKLALKLEPFYVNGPNASYWFKKWLVLKVLQSALEAINESDGLVKPSRFPSKKKLTQEINNLEANRSDGEAGEEYTVSLLIELVEEIISENDLTRSVILIDDAAHSFSEKQQEDFFDFFRAIKTRLLSPKAAIYPGITSNSASFHIGHDAEQIDAWVRPAGTEYEEFMISLATKRLEGTGANFISDNEEDIRFLAYASFGVPRGFLGMLRAIYNSPDAYLNSDGSLNKAKVLRLSRAGRDMSHAVFDSLTAKLPSYESYVENGSKLYQSILSELKAFNKGKVTSKQGIQFAIKTPLGADLDKVFGFLQYAGLIMPAGQVLKGEKGTFKIFDVHIGDLTAENTIVGKRTKSIPSFLEVIRATRHNAWPRLSTNSLFEAANVNTDTFTLSLPLCHSCDTPRDNPEAKFCSNCGAQLKPSSTYEALVQKDISVLPISSAMLKRIKSNSHIRKVRDILIDASRETLLGINYIGKVRATRIVALAEEHVS
ncbi:hypothetical protein ALP8811_02023 [Aliiroseovarius pelagivivens]|uniref:Uncharacterized protein n=1 Tax=Aliiroseovarius pelagivivens TaxID=1639690 RepID=A0A2R8AM94_9RHOB|nr:hypothetical protein [Aliiroseovarius pelagivivens]SPF77004.1 hypothetical protein ALP8811_02023 [Aliiroseovarius pelagivivens]